MTTFGDTLLEIYGSDAAILADRASELLDSPVHATIVDDPAFKVAVVKSYVKLFPEIKDSERPLILFETIVALVLAKLEQG